MKTYDSVYIKKKMLDLVQSINQTDDFGTLDRLVTQIWKKSD